MLHKPDRRDPSVQGKTSRAYCFPEMTVNCVDEERRTADQDVFQRICFDDSGKLILNRRYSDAVASGKEDTTGENIRDEGYIRGFKKGEADGLYSTEKKLQPLLKSLKQAVLALENARRELRSQMEREAVELALAVAEKVISREISINRDVVVDVLRTALKQAHGHERVAIRVSPEDFQFLKHGGERISGFPEDVTKIIEEDKSIAKGGCIVETNLGDVDARIEKQLQSVREHFEKEINRLGTGG